MLKAGKTEHPFPARSKCKKASLINRDAFLLEFLPESCRFSSAQ
jgi:hypothetical protein